MLKNNITNKINSITKEYTDINNFSFEIDMDKNEIRIPKIQENKNVILIIKDIFNSISKIIKITSMIEKDLIVEKNGLNVIKTFCIIKI